MGIKEMRIRDMYNKRIADYAEKYRDIRNDFKQLKTVLLTYELSPMTLVTLDEIQDKLNLFVESHQLNVDVFVIEVGPKFGNNG